ncbi:hypothetical protein EVAR_37009_1 [Eumeta japonica]|uniref:Uncharacterized protein n=1 Tax=Eumeta variegata TaxID=151549 RepID=A0A4C1X0R4_EUMVA|nr:hypothetical protein EVAR_37009_1 [Eumeta japonica]
MRVQYAEKPIANNSSVRARSPTPAPAPAQTESCVHRRRLFAARFHFSAAPLLGGIFLFCTHEVFDINEMPGLSFALSLFRIFKLNNLDLESSRLALGVL